MKRHSLGIALAVLTSINVDAQEARPDSATLDARLAAYIAPLVALGVFDGTVLVAHRDSVLVHRVYGMASIELNVPVNTRTRFRISSISKSFTTALVGRLVDKGRLSLDDPISRWLPRFPSAGAITIRQMIDHRAGIPSVNSLPYDEEALGPNTLAMLVDSIGRLPLDFSPGTSRRYSNGGYAVLARVIEIIEGVPFEVSLQREVLVPAGLSETTHESNGLVLRNMASGYAPSAEVRGVVIKAAFQETETKAGGGSMVSSAPDMLEWMRSIGRSSLLRPATWAALFPMTSGRIAFSGRSPGYNSYVLHERDGDLTVVVLANNYAAGMTGDIAEAAIAITKGRAPAALPVSAPVAVAPGLISSLPGRYDMPAGALPVPPGMNIELRASNGDLVVYLGSTAVDVLIPQPGGKFLSRTLWSMVEPVAASAGRPAGLEIRALYRDHSFRATRMP